MVFSRKCYKSLSGTLCILSEALWYNFLILSHKGLQSKHEVTQSKNYE